MKVSPLEVANTLGYLDMLYGALTPKGSAQPMIAAWCTTLEDVDVEPGDLFTAAKAWAKDPENQYYPKPGQLIPLIDEEHRRKLNQARHDNWMKNGGLIRTGGVLVNRDGEECDEHGVPIAELGEGKPKDAELDELVRRITKQVRKSRK